MSVNLFLSEKGTISCSVGSLLNEDKTITFSAIIGFVWNEDVHIFFYEVRAYIENIPNETLRNLCNELTITTENYISIMLLKGH